LRTLSLCTCCRHYPGAAAGRTLRSASPNRISLPRKGCRVGLRIVLFEACSAFTRITACTLALSPIRDTLTRGFSHFVSSMTAPVASGWSRCRVGFAPTGKRRLSTAHTLSGPSAGVAIIVANVRSRASNHPAILSCRACGASHNRRSKRGGSREKAMRSVTRVATLLFIAIIAYSMAKRPMVRTTSSRAAIQRLRPCGRPMMTPTSRARSKSTSSSIQRCPSRAHGAAISRKEPSRTGSSRCWRVVLDNSCSRRTPIRLTPVYHST
jgi:hypothetical protein